MLTTSEPAKSRTIFPNSRVNCVNQFNNLRKIWAKTWSNPKTFWRYCNSKLKNKPRIWDIKSIDGTKTYFASVFIRKNVEDMPSLETKYRGPTLSDVNTTTELVKKS